MRSLLLAIVVLSSIQARALLGDPPPEPRVIFNPVVSTSARTLPQWQVGFQKAGGANINSNVLANALSVGLLPRLEAGIIPAFYLSAPGSSNFTTKVNFYKGERFDWAASFSETRFRSQVTENGKVIEEPDLILRSIQVGFNYRPAWDSNVTLSPFLTQVCGHIDSTNGTVFVYSLKCQAEWGLDIQYQIKDREWITFAMGQLREAGLSPYEDMNMGLGVAWSQFRPKELLSRPSLGLYHTPDTGSTLLLISTTFYEM